MLQSKVAGSRKFWVLRHHLRDNQEDRLLQRHVRSVLPEDIPSQRWYRRLLILSTLLAPLEEPAPMMAMRGGMSCLFFSVICFAAYSQHRAVWVACVAITAIQLPFIAFDRLRAESRLCDWHFLLQN